jgi:GNAT superfamily N-acetyltransferase
MDVQNLHAELHPDVFKRPQREDFAVSFFDNMLADSTITVFIAEEAGQALGYILCKLIEREEGPFTYARRYLLVDQISVRPSARRHGLGAALIEQVVALGKELNLRQIQLDSWDFNVSAHQFFEHNGFEKFNYRFWRTI